MNGVQNNHCVSRHIFPSATRPTINKQIVPIYSLFHCFVSFFFQMEDSGLPEGVVEIIYKKVHQIGWNDVSTVIDSLYSPFEKHFISLYDNYSEVFFEPEVVEEYLSIDTSSVLFIKLSNTRFVLFYNYTIEGINDQMMMEGCVDEQTYQVQFDRFYHTDTWKHYPKLITSVEEYLQHTINPNIVPFKLIHRRMLGHLDIPFEMELSNYRTSSVSTLSKKLQKKLFDTMFDWYLEYTN
jgi:hypothetical protein